MDDPYASLDSTERAYIGLHSAMMKMYSDGDVRFIDIANTLILKADLPSLIRARCYMALSTVEGQEAVAVKFAETAVQLLDVDVRKLVLPDAFPERQLAVAKECLADAQERKRVKDASKIKKGSKSAASPAATTSTTAQTNPPGFSVTPSAPVPGLHDAPVSLTGFGRSSGFLPTPGSSRNPTLQDPPEEPEESASLRQPGIATPGPSRNVSLQEQTGSKEHDSDDEMKE